MKNHAILWGLLIVLFLLGVYFYPQMPARMVSHWNASGEANGFLPKIWALFLLPAITLVLVILLLLVPRMDPLRNNVRQFKKYYMGFVILLVCFMLVLQIQLILWNLGMQIDMNILMPLLLGILFFYTGILLKHSKRNWFIGIRTPWTLSSDKVWDKTHNIGGDLFKICGIISIVGIVSGKFSLLFSILPILIVSIFTVVYSYVIYSKKKK